MEMEDGQVVVELVLRDSERVELEGRQVTLQSLPAIAAEEEHLSLRRWSSDRIGVRNMSNVHAAHVEQRPEDFLTEFLEL